MPVPAKARALAVRFFADGLFAILSLALVVWVSWDAFSFRLVSFNPGADYWEHTAVLHALLEDPWHPRHPLIAAPIPSPRFNPHLLLAALVGRLFGLDALGAMGLSALFNTLLFVAGIWLFFRTYFRDARASLFGLVVSFGAWADAPHFSNVYQLDIYFSVAGYPSTAALGMTLIGFSLTVRALRAKRAGWPLLAALSLLWADVYVTHPLTATMGLTVAVLLAMTEPAVLLRDRLRIGGTAVLGLLLAGFWPYYPALSMVAGGTATRVSREIALHRTASHSFYDAEMLLRIVGVSLLAIPVLGWFLVRRRHLFVPLGVFAMLVVFVTSAFVPIPLGHRYVLLAMPLLHVALVWLLLGLVPRAPVSGILSRRWPRLTATVAVAVALVLLVVVNVSMARGRFVAVSPTLEPRDSLPIRVGQTVGNLAGPSAVVLGTPLASWSIPTFGPKVVTLHHRNPLIADADERAHAAATFFAPGTPAAERRRIVETYGVTHVLASTPPTRALERFLAAHATEHPLPGRSTLFALEE